MTKDLKREHIDKLAGRYSSLFTLPSHKDVTIFLCIEGIATGVAAELPYDPSLHGLTVGLLLGILLFSATQFGNYLTAHIFLRKDLILNHRRCSFLSLASNLFLLVFAFIASLTSTSFSNPNIWLKVALLGVYATLTLRFLVFSSVSSSSSLRIFISAIFQPSLFLILLSLIPLLFRGLQPHLFLYFPVAVATAFIGVYIFTASVDVMGMKTLGIPSIKIFKAFLADWTEGLEKPLEEILEQLGIEREVKVSMIAFRTGERMKAAIVVPGIHPGPFRNVGSSAIPSLIQKALEEKLGCIVSVPHGISGHELDLSSQHQNQRVLKRIIEASEFGAFNPYATPTLSLRKDNATVNCQIFGDCALLTLTLAPETMEDLPLELDDFITQKAKAIGVTGTIVIDAHNSIQGPFNLEEAVSSIKEAVPSALDKAISLTQSRFEVGAAEIVMEHFGIKDGIGPGGICVVIVKVGDQKTAYVTLDGNNMVSGLREKMLSSLKELEVDCGEILTTDTHIVNAVVMADRGYRPVGEVIDHDKLIKHTKMAVTEALENIEPAAASWLQVNIHGVRTIGEQQIDDLSLMVDKAARKAKKISTLVFPAIGILFTLLIIFI